MHLLLLAALIGLGSTITVDNCSNNLTKDKYLAVFGNSCFRFFVSNEKDYPNARTTCQSKGGDLAMPKTKEMNDFISKQLVTLGVKKDTWIGLTDMDVEDLFMWADNTPLTWENFGTHEGTTNPSFLLHHFEDCTAVTPKDGIWHDYHCNNLFFGLISFRKPFVCQYPATRGVTTAPPATTGCPVVECDLDCGLYGYKYNKATDCLECKCDV